MTHHGIVVGDGDKVHMYEWHGKAAQCLLHNLFSNFNLVSQHVSSCVAGIKVSVLF